MAFVHPTGARFPGWWQMRCWWRFFSELVAESGNAAYHGGQVETRFYAWMREHARFRIGDESVGIYSCVAELVGSGARIC